MALAPKVSRPQMPLAVKAAAAPKPRATALPTITMPMATSTIHCGTSDWISRYWAVSAPMKIWSMSDLTVPSHSDTSSFRTAGYSFRKTLSLPVASRFLP